MYIDHLKVTRNCMFPKQKAHAQFMI